ncbi:hypothetical protein F1B92_00740 [Campylobacter sp. FMV-PI01]|uniref:Uncharacterized protein n=1 Tax=Campylobacter portucalensis TaxID=2608384 RepID=A0A6L5WFJ7_9BACT|nr:hypothetical protein [Campylobacter portucalensis]MSN95734.1 hypothetical protein [Campylobacter portucalensis]
MEKFSIQEAAQKLGISKEAIYNRIRRNVMKSVEENGIKYVILEKLEKKDSTKQPSKKSQNLIHQENSEFISYLKNEIEYLKLKNKSLLEDKEKLFREKEELLMASKNEIKMIYQERDEKLKYFLSILERPILPQTDKIEAKAIDIKNDEWIELGSFLDSLNLKKKKRKNIKKFIIKNAYTDENLKIQNGMVLVNKNFDILKINDKDDNEEY